ncbi:MAG: type IV pili twitching motility protein PilT [Candidatus Marinimicrobia bacterium]|nr:type IV pili twitching motility protein PilT [Candidatus Neomarinimicrobiota bacterium]|tara:strand:+ start:4911 stop:5969 length:1059 start_codon:yes stop_codon:yes gene_type:complete
MHTLNNLLKLMTEKNASDLHITVGSAPRIRINGNLKAIDENKLSEKEIETILQEHLNNEQLKSIKNGNEIDFTIGITGLSRFRVNAFLQRENIVATFRRLPYDIPEINTLDLPESVINLTQKRKGLILITGGTGSGKSTTLAAMIQKISQELEGHIITIEDPIEYLYNHSKSLINQREIGVDSNSFSSALKSSLRQDPDVVSIGELRDVDSMSTALTIAETGHLVLGTLHTNNASGTITRLIDAFEPEKQEIIRMNLSMSLLAIVSQQLIPNIENNRSLAIEVLVNTPSMQAVIRENNIHQIDNYLLSGAKDGMIRMDDSILALYNDNLITKENALSYCHHPNELSKKLVSF